jgi:glucose/arabinose dehydrogenase
MAFAPDGRLFVAEQADVMQVVNTDGTLQSTPFLDISDNKVNAAGERGLLGVAFDTDFDPTFDTIDNNYIYVYYTTVDTSVHNRVSRFPTAEDINGNVVTEVEEEEFLFELPPLSATNHNGGAIHFGTDGKLYVAVGENPRPAAAQYLNTTLGKMLRTNKDGTIPTDNPFNADTTGDNQAIWAAGLRNPYSFDVQPGTGRIFINDVGQQTFEEINEGKAGGTYGWPVNEGPIRYQVPKKKKKGHHKKKRRHKRPAAPFYKQPAPCLLAQRRMRDHQRRVLRPSDETVPASITLATTSLRTCAGVGSANTIPPRDRCLLSSLAPASSPWTLR